MKRQLISIAIAASTVLAAIPDAQAMPPRQHSVNGVIETIEGARRIITLKSKDGATQLTFVWNDTTRFSRKGGCAKCSFDSGQTVHVWYRREIGQNVLREVTTKGVSAACGKVCN